MDPRATSDPTDPVLRLRFDEEARRRSREVWAHLEVIQTLPYFSRDVAQACREAGLANRMQSYCAMRAAPLGAASSELVTATFYGFAPRLVAAAVPTVWEVIRPEQALELTHRAVGSVLHELLSGLDVGLSRATELARQAALLHPTIGRPLGAAWASVPWDDDPIVGLWQAATRIRESRGDGHVALLVAHGLDGIESHLTLAGDSPKLRERMGPLRGWTDPEWDAGAERLLARGLLAEDGSLTGAGAALRRHLEDATDDLAAEPWQTLGADATDHLMGALRPMVERIAAAEILPSIVIRRALSPHH